MKIKTFISNPWAIGIGSSFVAAGILALIPFTKSFLKQRINTPIWFFLLIVFVSVVASFLRSNSGSSRKHKRTEPKWKIFRTYTFKTLPWAWDYRGANIVNFRPLCPKCHGKLAGDNAYLRCPNLGCDFSQNNAIQDEPKITERVYTIKHMIASGEYEKHLKSQIEPLFYE